MIYVYIAQNADKTQFLNDVLSRHIPAPFEILKGENGKPYIKNNPVYFNLSHSGNYCAVAISGSPVGVDIEVCGKGIRKAVLSTFPHREQSEIITETDFLNHWTARESYIKYCGGTLAHMLKLLEFSGGVLHYKDSPAAPQPRLFPCKSCSLAVCGDGEITIITDAV
ncbi:MAG: hypothetical protein LUI60_04340 [Clostridia bacterium]|nr:hypothetical protein [Clostridia bacterium]